MFPQLLRASGIAVFAAGIAASVGNADGLSQKIAMICINPASGTSWRIGIDYSRSTVDSFPAQFSAAEISWHDERDGGSYTLDRKSGELSVVFASSTGGYFLHDRCISRPSR
jgi:hypothetical protein